MTEKMLKSLFQDYNKYYIMSIEIKPLDFDNRWRRYTWTSHRTYIEPLFRFTQRSKVLYVFFGVNSYFTYGFFVWQWPYISWINYNSFRISWIYWRFFPRYCMHIYSCIHAFWYLYPALLCISILYCASLEKKKWILQRRVNHYWYG